MKTQTIHLYRYVLMAFLQIRPNDNIIRAFRAGFHLLVVAAITYSLFWFLKTLLTGMNPVPVHDHWTIFRFSERSVVDWFSARNGNPLFFPRIFYYLDIYLAHGTGYLLTACSVILQSMIVILVFRLLHSGGIDTLDGHLTAAFCILPIAFATVNFFNYMYGFMFHWFLSSSSFVLAVVSVASLSRSTSSRREWLVVATAIAASIISALSMASGILAMFAAAVIGLVTPQKKRIRWLFLMAAMAGLAIYYVVYFGHRPTPLDLTKFSVVDAIVFALIYVGAPVAHAIDTATNVWANQDAIAHRTSFLAILSLITGIGGNAVMLWILRRVWTQRSSSTGTSLLALLCIQGWVVVTSLLTYSTRMQLGIEQAMASQYWTMGILFWVTIPASVLLALNSVSGKRIANVAVIALFLLILAIVGSQAGFREWARGVYDSQYVAAVMLASGVHDEEFLGLTFHPNHSPGDRWQDVGWIREKHASFFSEHWFNGLGKKLEDWYPMIGAKQCDGNVLGVPTRIESGDHRGWRIGGWAVEPLRRRPITHLILANYGKEIVGFGWGGIRPAKPSDIPAPWQSQRVGWLGYASNSATGNITVYGALGSQSVCGVSEFVLPPASK